MVPWVTAPGGPCEALDDPSITIMWFQWAARMFKTSFCQGAQMKYVDEDPCNMMFASVDHSNVKSVFRRYWKMLDKCPGTRDQCPIEKLRGSELIKLRKCTIYGAWVRGASTLADKAIRVGHGNEIDKWVHLSTSTEGDPLNRFLKRGNQFPDRKFMLESTPSVKNRSRVEAGRLRSSNSQYYVPCPHCGTFDIIHFGDGKEAPGIFWETKDGRNDPDHAKKTAYYVCGHCKNDINDIHRPMMMTQGIWVPEGCKVDHDKAIRARELPPDDKSYLIGEPVRKNNEWGSQISVFYAMFHGWGDIAADFLKAKPKKKTLQQWTNEDKAETWELVENKQTWEQLAESVITQDKSLTEGIVPDGAKFLTIAIDCQQSDYPYAVEAWSADDANHVVRRGRAQSLDELFESVVNQEYRTVTSGMKFKICMGLIDGGFKPKNSHEFSIKCRANNIHVLVCKGSKAALDYDYNFTELGEKTSAPGEQLVHVDTTRSQYHLESILADPRGKFSVFHASKWEWHDYFEELLNDAAIEHIDSTNNVTERWERIDESMPNDHRDVKRYNWIAMRAVVKDLYHSDVILETHPVLDGMKKPVQSQTRQRKDTGFSIRQSKLRKFSRGMRRG